MAFKCGFFNSVNGDRKYNADEMSNPYKEIVSNGVLAKTDDSDGFQVQADGGLKIILKKGSGIFAGKWAILDADMSLTIPTHVTMTRIDSVIVRIDNNENVRNGSIEYVQGEASTNPVAPELTRTSSVTEYRLANITVEANITTLSQSKIKDTRPTSECGFVTNLLQDSDITATFRQWEAQFQEWLIASKTEWDQEQREYEAWTSNKRWEFDTWYDNIKDTLSKTNLMTSYFSTYTTTGENESEISINISAFNSVLDCLQVHVNGMLLVPEVDYTVLDFKKITLTKPLDLGTTVTFSLLKTIDGSEAETVVKQVQDIFVSIDDLKKTTSILHKKVIGIETGTNVSNELEPLPHSLISNSSILVEAQNKMYGMSFSQLKGDYGKIAVIPISTSEKKEVGEMWIENEISKVNKTIFNFSEIGTKKQCACISDILYVLNTNGKLFKVDLKNNTCESLYQDLTFEFIQVTDTLIVFAGLNSANTVAIQYRTGTEYRFADNNADNFLSSVDKVFNFGNTLNKSSCFTVNDTENKILQMFQFKITDDKLNLYYDSDNAIEYDELKDYTVGVIYGVYGNEEENEVSIVLSSVLEEINISSDTIYCLFMFSLNPTSYVCRQVIQSEETKYILFDPIIATFEEKEFYSDDEVTSEVIQMIIGKYKFYTLQKALNNKVAVIKYEFSQDGILTETKLQVTDSVADPQLVIDLDQQDKVDSSQVITPELVVCGNTPTFNAEKTDYEYSSKLKIKLPNGIKNIGVTE